MRITRNYRDKILEELDALELTQGRTTLTVELHCGTDGVPGSMKVKTFTEKEVRA